MSEVRGEIALTFGCESAALIGVLHPGTAQAQTGVVIVVGGPQYRSGSHRQFVLLARALARHGVPVFRFDYRGMGDSDGPVVTFETVDRDISAAIDTLFAQVPSLTQVILWGLCDAASAGLFYAHQDKRVAGLVILNPWVRTEAGMARTYMKHYYLQRFLSREFWSKVVRGQFDIKASLRSLNDFINKMRGTSAAPVAGSNGSSVQVKASVPAALPDRMASAWEKFSGPVLLILSVNNDYVADEFRDVAQSSNRWRKLLQRSSTTRKDFPGANHTFSRRDWRDQVAEWTRVWIATHFSH